MCTPKAGFSLGLARVVAPARMAYLDCGNTECRQHRRNSLDRFSTRFAAFGIGVLILAHITGFMEGIRDILVAVGALVVGVIVGYVWVRLWIAKRRMAMAALTAPLATPTLTRGHHNLPAVPQSQQPAIPTGGDVHNHIHLHGLSDEQVAGVVRGQR